MIGRADCLGVDEAVLHWKAKGVDLRPLLHQPKLPPSVARRRVIAQDHGLEAALDNDLIAAAAPALERRQPVAIDAYIRNADRTVGTMLGYEVTKRYGGQGLPDDTIQVAFTGTAGQSFGAFVPRGMTLTLEGDANDYWGKGLSGGKLIVRPPRAATFVAEENVLIGNVALYGATGGEAYVDGLAGERFAVRNSGALAVVDGIGDHGCEYMTGGRVVVLGRTGRNCAAGMSGGIAYVLDADGVLSTRCNHTLVDLEDPDDDDLETVRGLMARHVQYTGSALAGRLLADWTSTRTRFVKVMPRDYRRVLAAEAKALAEDREPAFEELTGVVRG
jgi:glutamate synthase domain-containing protein 3